MKPARRPVPPRLEINDPKTMKVQILRFGSEKIPILVVDDVLANVDAVRAYAKGLHYVTPAMTEPSYYAACTIFGTSPLGTWVAGRLCSEGFGLDPEEHLRDGDTESSFRLFAPTKQHKYGTIHVTAHSWVSIILGLTPGEPSGTGFWRHVPTGLESAVGGTDPFDLMVRIDQLFKTQHVAGARAARAFAPKTPYNLWLRQLFQSSSSRQPFPNTDHGDWKLIGAVPTTYNRLVAFPAWAFHSIVMSQDTGTTLDTARITMNLFVRHQALEPRERLPAEPMPGLEP
jgi:hypothetical protein